MATLQRTEVTGQFYNYSTINELAKRIGVRIGGQFAAAQVAQPSDEVDLSWLADDPAPRTDGIYGEYQQALSDVKKFRSDLSVEGEQLWLNAFRRSVSLRQQIVAQESRE